MPNLTKQPPVQTIPDTLEANGMRASVQVLGPNDKLYYRVEVQYPDGSVGFKEGAELDAADVAAVENFLRRFGRDTTVKSRGGWT